LGHPIAEWMVSPHGLGFLLAWKSDLALLIEADDSFLSRLALAIIFMSGRSLMFTVGPMLLSEFKINKLRDDDIDLRRVAL